MCHSAKFKAKRILLTEGDKKVERHFISSIFWKRFIILQMSNSENWLHIIMIFDDFYLFFQDEKLPNHYFWSFLKKCKWPKNDSKLPQYIKKNRQKWVLTPKLLLLYSSEIFSSRKIPFLWFIIFKKFMASKLQWQISYNFLKIKSKN